MPRCKITTLNQLNQQLRIINKTIRNKLFRLLHRDGQNLGILKVELWCLTPLLMDSKRPREKARILKPYRLIKKALLRDGQNPDILKVELWCQTPLLMDLRRPPERAKIPRLCRLSKKALPRDGQNLVILKVELWCLMLLLMVSRKPLVKVKILRLLRLSPVPMIKIKRRKAHRVLLLLLML